MSTCGQRALEIVSRRYFERFDQKNKSVELERLKVKIIDIASHDLYTPLAAILGFSELLLNPEQCGGIDPDRQMDFLGIIHHQAKVLEQTVDGILNVDQNQKCLVGSLDREVCSIDDLVDEAVAALGAV